MDNQQNNPSIQGSSIEDMTNYVSDNFSEVTDEEYQGNSREIVLSNMNNIKNWILDNLKVQDLLLLCQRINGTTFKSSQLKQDIMAICIEGPYSFGFDKKHFDIKNIVLKALNKVTPR